MKRWLSLAVCILALAAMPATVMAGQDSVHFGPISSGSPDSGTCRPVWANDTYMRVFDAATTPTGGTYTVTETFIAGRFVTVAGSSPGACEGGSNNGGMIEDGVTGSFNGNFQVVVSNQAPGLDPATVTNRPAMKVSVTVYVPPVGVVAASKTRM